MGESFERLAVGGQGGYLTAQRRELQLLVRDFVAAEVTPAANELDPVKGDIPLELRQKMADMGLFAILIPEEYGGLGLGVFEYCLVAEELARGWMSVASILARGNNAFGSLFNEEQRRSYLPRVARGEFLSAVALSEAEAGSDVANIRCRAQHDGDEWVLNGTKMWCTFADGADYLIVLARTDPDVDPTRRHRGISAFLIEKDRGTFPPGVEGQPIRKIGYHGWSTFDLFFQNCRLPPSALLGEEGRGFYGIMADLETARAHTAARSIGLARGALEDSIGYVAEREQFGRPIGDFQAIRFKIATMATEIEAARQLMYHVATQIDQGNRCDTEASMAKYFASEMAERVTSEGLQIHGGAGYTTDFPLERYWRDARLTRIFEGTSEIQQRIISDALLGRPTN